MQSVQTSGKSNKPGRNRQFCGDTKWPAGGAGVKMAAIQRKTRIPHEEDFTTAV